MIETKLFPGQKGPYPLACQWELTCRCNLRCVMCYTDCFNTPDKIREELATDEIYRIMDEIREAGCLELCLTGGEPLARPDFFAIYERVIRSGFLVTVFTNGTLIDEKAADRFAALPPHRMEISLHGISAPIFEGVTQQSGSFARCMKAIKALSERRVPVLLKTVAMTLNQEEVLQIKSFVAGLPGVQFHIGLYMRPVLDGSRGPFQYELSDEAIDRLFEGETQILEEICQSRIKERGCGGGRLRFHIDAYGGLQLCSGNRRQSYDLRKGSFQEGFYKRLPDFPCPKKGGGPAVIASPGGAKQSQAGS